MSSETDGDPPPEDGRPRGRDAWKAETKGVERVIDVVTTVDDPQTAGWIAEEALVSEQSAREHLEMLAELGVVTATTARGVTKYRPDSAFLRFREVSRLVEKHDKSDLLDRAQDGKERIQDVTERYGVDSPDELRSRAVADDTSLSELTEYRKVAAEWETLEHELDVIQEAVERYDEFDRGSVSV